MKIHKIYLRKALYFFLHRCQYTVDDFRKRIDLEAPEFSQPI